MTDRDFILSIRDQCNAQLAGAVNPVTPPVTPPVIPPITPPAVPGNVVMVTLKPAGQSPVMQMQAGVIYCAQVPAVRGTFNTTRDPQTPGAAQVRAFLSLTPGDPSFADSPASCYTQFGAKQCPCSTQGNPESVGIKWDNQRSQSDTPCVVPAGAYLNWYMSESGPLVYGWF